ncbi:P-loop NTPase fold protein [Actinokineospora enzanensis]|uniref:P-loop NTPase fold protein n=1 Tax=Actinokineospora enzanensis TaxID=155975 RepID=UPI000365ACEF|nr:P-loop NTPase fold protein [Actinokineospora enzanensis]
MRLGYINGWEIAAVHTDQPWNIPVGTVVLPLRSLPAMAEELGLDLGEIVRADEEGRAIRLDPGPSLWYRSLVVGSSHRFGRFTRSVALPAREDFDPGQLLAFVHEECQGHRGELVVLYGSDEDFVWTMSEAWREFAGEGHPDVTQTSPSTELQGGVAGDLVVPTASIASTADMLDVSPYAAMLASVIADARTPVPLSIGVFGEWGAGKSYFMGLLRGRIRERTGAEGNCGRIVHIGFNAWHYADADLWASLGDVVFRDLAAEVEQAAESGRGEMERRLVDKMNHRREVEQVVDSAAEAAARLQAEIDSAAEKHVSTTADLLGALFWSDTLRARAEQTWARIGITDEVDKARALSDELRRTADDVTTLRGMTGDRQGRMALVAAAVVLGLTAVLVLAGGLLAAWIGGATAALTAVVGSTLVVRARSGVASLRSLAVDLRAGMDSAGRKRLDEGIRDRVDELRKVEAGQCIAEKQLAELVDEVGEMGARLAEFHPAHRMSAFLADRAGGDRYTRGLSTVSLVRKDFEELVKLLAEWRAEPGDGARPIDRVVLYIDDLDRCGPRHVVAVLEAVHLILALDLFVVVIGVDPRWLLRSLTVHHADTLDDRTLDHWRVSPEDYLEKIINIPFTLPRMSDAAVGRLFRSLAPSPPAPTRTVRPGPGGPFSDHGQPPRLDVPLTLHPKEPLPRTEPTAPEPLTEREWAFLDNVAGLVRTPRAAKRLLNIYRVLRATRDLSDATRFLGTDAEPGEFQAVVILLAILTAAPRRAARVFTNLTDADHGTPWPDFAADLGDPDPPEDWRRLCQDLRRVSAMVTLPNVSPFQQWVPMVRRFSYLLD